MIVENEFTTPFGMAAANTEMKSKIAFGSTNATKPCFFTNFLFLIPVSFPATRFTAMRRCLSFRNRALEGASGRKKNMKIDQRHVAPPSCIYLVSKKELGEEIEGSFTMKKISSQRAGVMSAGSLDTPIEM